MRMRETSCWSFMKFDTSIFCLLRPSWALLLLSHSTALILCIIVFVCLHAGSLIFQPGLLYCTSCSCWMSETNQTRWLCPSPTASVSAIRSGNEETFISRGKNTAWLLARTPWPWMCWPHVAEVRPALRPDNIYCCLGMCCNRWREPKQSKWKSTTSDKDISRSEWRTSFSSSLPSH